LFSNERRHGGIGKEKYRGQSKVEKKVKYGGRKITVGRGGGVILRVGRMR
jgi:hypothetical protein